MSNNNATKILDTIDTHTYLGIGIGTTRIKALLIGSDFQTIASWSYELKTNSKMVSGLIHYMRFGETCEKVIAN